MTAGRYVDRTRDDDAVFEEERARWEAAEIAPGAWPVEIGGLDPTIDNRGPLCGVEDQDGHGCTWPPRHPGLHVAGGEFTDGGYVYAVWPQDGPR